MSDGCKNADTPDEKDLIRKKAVFKQIADLLKREELISHDEKMRFLSYLKGE